MSQNTQDMPGADRDDDSGQYTQKYPTEKFLQAIDNAEGMAGTQDVADYVGCSYETAYKKLRKFEDSGSVNSQKVANARVWLRADEPTPPERRERGVTPSEDTDDGMDTSAGTSTRTTREDPAPLSLDTADFPNSRDREDCLAAVDAARRYLREHGSATMRDLVMNVMPAHPVGYSVDDAREKFAAGDRYRGGWWRLVVRPGLEALDDVEKPPRGGSDWEYVGGDDQDADTDPLDESGPYDPTDEWGGT